CLLVLMAVGLLCSYSFFTVTVCTAIYTLSLHDALPIFQIIFDKSEGLKETSSAGKIGGADHQEEFSDLLLEDHDQCKHSHTNERSEEHTSELQSRENLVCRLLLEKKNK